MLSQFVNFSQRDDISQTKMFQAPLLGLNFPDTFQGSAPSQSLLKEASPGTMRRSSAQNWIKEERKFTAASSISTSAGNNASTRSVESPPHSQKVSMLSRGEMQGARVLEEGRQDPNSSTSITKSDVVNKQDNEENINETNSSSKSNQQPGGLPSYTAMIAQAILSRDGHKCTLSEIYEYMEKKFPSLERRGTGWRNCVRHTLSLNDCFVKLHRPENGRSCNWAIHPSYFDSFSRGDFRKRRAVRKRSRNIPWMESLMMNPLPYMRDQEFNALQNQAHMGSYSSGLSLWGFQPPYTPPFNSNGSSFQSLMQTQNASSPHFASTHCSNPNCYCQSSVAPQRPMRSPYLP